MPLKPLIAGATALALGAVSAGAATAAEATLSLNIRSGPGPEHRVVDILQPGEEVRVLDCTETGNWCEIRHHGPDGWVYARYLDDATPVADEPVVEVSTTDDTVSVAVTFGTGDTGVQFRMYDVDENTDDAYLRPNAACFYELPDFGGQSFCVSEGAGEQQLGSFWNDRISSIRVLPGIAVKVCDTEGMRGRCGDVTRSYRFLGEENDDVISSYQVY